MRMSDAAVESRTSGDLPGAGQSGETDGGRDSGEADGHHQKRFAGHDDEGLGEICGLKNNM